VSAFFDILTGYFLINLSSLSSKECAMGVALKIATGEILSISKIPQKSAEFWYPINSFV